MGREREDGWQRVGVGVWFRVCRTGREQGGVWGPLPCGLLRRDGGERAQGGPLQLARRRAGRRARR